MITMTFDAYDALSEEMELIEIEDDFQYPQIETVPALLSNEKGLRTVLLAYFNTSDKKYRGQLSQIMNQMIALTDSEEELTENEQQMISINKKGRFNNEKHQEILNIVKNMPFQLIGYYPTKEEIEANISTPTEVNLAFLYWLLNTEEELSQEEEKTKKFIIKHIGAICR